MTELLRVARVIKGLSAFLHNETKADLKFNIDSNPDLGEAICLMPLSLAQVHGKAGVIPML